jgi:RNA polymerase subunit RPABC4/transcription elongation factor Spt4
MSDFVQKGADEMFCPSCRAVIKKAAELCPKCGVPKAKWRNQEGSSEVFCSSCGEKILKEAEICPKCGVRQFENVSSGRLTGDTITSEVFCTSCGEKILKEAEICPKCGVRQSSIRLIGDIIKTSDKWAWTLASVPLLLFVIDKMLETIIYGTTLTVVSWIIAIALNVTFFLLDKKQLEKDGFNPEGWMWLGIVLVPVYLFLRASKTTKKYGYAITWLITFFVSFLIRLKY